MKIEIEYNEEDVKSLVLKDLKDKLDIELVMKDVKFEVITKENYRAEHWEQGRFRAKVLK